jgi:hypothetical protein
MSARFVNVVPLLVEPVPNPRTYEKPVLLSGMWLEGIRGSFVDVVAKLPPEPHLTELHDLLVIDHAAYVRGLLARLSVSEPNVVVQRRDDASPDLFADHPLEMFVHDEDMIKLVMSSCMLAGASAFIINRPLLVEMKESGDAQAIPEMQGYSNLRYVWQRPRPLASKSETEAGRFPELDLAEVARYCVLLEPYFRPTHWHAGRVAVAVGSLLSYALSSDPAQGYLALMITFEALLSTERTELTHQICERVACLLETDEDARYRTYIRMKQLYKTRSMFIHGDVINKHGVITFDRARFDAKLTNVPDDDLRDLFELSLRLIRVVLGEPELIQLLEQRKSEPLNEWYLRKLFSFKAR